MLLGEMTNRVGGSGVASEQERLAATAPEIDLAPVTTSARLGHPIGTAKSPKHRVSNQIFSSEVSRTLGNSSPRISRAVWQGKTAPSGATVRKTRPHPCRHALGNC